MTMLLLGLNLELRAQTPEIVNIFAKGSNAKQGVSGTWQLDWTSGLNTTVYRTVYITYTNQKNASTDFIQHDSTAIRKTGSGELEIIIPANNSLDIDGSITTAAGDLLFTGIDQNSNTQIIEQNKFVVFPNPSNDKQVYVANSQNQSIETILVKNQLGQTLKQFPINQTQSLVPINLQELPTGMYILQISQPNNIENHAIIIK